MGKDSMVKKCEVTLSRETVQDILASEVAKIIASHEDWLAGAIKEMLFYREPKRYSSDKENPTMFESYFFKAIKPMIEEELSRQQEKFRMSVRNAIEEAFKSKEVTEQFTKDALITKFTDAFSRFRFFFADS